MHTQGSREGLARQNRLEGLAGWRDRSHLHSKLLSGRLGDSQFAHRIGSETEDLLSYFIIIENGVCPHWQRGANLQEGQKGRGLEEIGLEGRGLEGGKGSSPWVSVWFWVALPLLPSEQELRS